MQRPIYLPPRVTDYGSVVAMAADAGLFMPAVFGASSLSTPVSPNAGGELPASAVSPGGTPTEGGVAGGATSGGVAGGAASGGAPGTVATAGGGGGTEGGGKGGLAFTGFAAGVVAAVGGALTATGAALARALRRDR